MAERWWIGFEDCTSKNETDKGIWVEGLVEEGSDLFVPYSQIDMENRSGSSEVTGPDMSGMLVVTDWWVDQQTSALVEGEEVAERPWEY